MDVLLNMEPVTSPQNVKGLRHLYDLVESHFRSLKSLGVTSDSYSSVLSPVPLNKLRRLIVSQEVSEADWSLDSLLKVIATEIKARERPFRLTTAAARIRVNPSNCNNSNTRNRSNSTILLLLPTGPHLHQVPNRNLGGSTTGDFEEEW